MEEDNQLDVDPFDLNFEFNGMELFQLKESFDSFADHEGKISFYEIFQSFEDEAIQNGEKLVYDILKRIVDFVEVSGDRRIDFDEFVQLLKRALNMRNKVQ